MRERTLGNLFLFGEDSSHLSKPLENLGRSRLTEQVAR